MSVEKFNVRQFVLIVLITSIWINASEIFRYFLFVMPMMKAHWGEVSEGIAAMDWVIFSIWGAWDTLLTLVLVFVVWLYCQVFGDGLRSIVSAATVVWAAIFIIFWVAASNMGLSDWNILLVALPLSWIEMVVGAWIVVQLYRSGRWV